MSRPKTRRHPGCLLSPDGDRTGRSATARGSPTRSRCHRRGAYLEGEPPPTSPTGPASPTPTSTSTARIVALAEPRLEREDGKCSPRCG
ncbi:hypothetical protein HBB16_19200 [Pseudonocardia sp. MCCB 268]|nr:hypothetical protein [Pseudonocardia cytotoxica]